MKKIFFILFFFFCIFGLAESSLAAPSISGVVGTASNGQTLTISGSSFGSGPNVVLFDDFEKGTNGSSIMTGSGSAQVGQWDKTEGERVPKYSNAAKVSGNLSFRADMSSYWRELTEVALPANTRKLFMSWWLFLPSGDNLPGEGSPEQINWKQVWVQGSGTVDDDLTMPVFLPGSYLINGNDGLYTKYINIDFNKGQWKRMWFYVYAGYANDGTMQFYEMTSSGVQTRDNNTGATILKNGGLFERIDINGYARVTSNSHPTYDDIYVATGDNARARIEIGNASSYANCTNLAVITPTSWGTGSISGVVRQGSFTSGQTAYIFITDSSGSISNGYPITIGGGTTPPNTAPAAPTGVKVI